LRIKSYLEISGT